jgi:hypothetical protein
MMKRHFKKLLVIFVGVILTLPCITISNSYAQEKTVTVGADKIKAALLRPGGWIAEWHCNMGNQETDFLFEARGENVVVKINVAAWNQTCERDVTITSDVVKMDGCNATNIKLTFDPDNHVYPFIGGNQNCNVKLRAK